MSYVRVLSALNNFVGQLELVSSTFVKDVVLLSHPPSHWPNKKIPRPVQTQKLILHQNRQIIQGVDIPKELNSDELMQFLEELFREKLNDAK